MGPKICSDQWFSLAFDLHEMLIKVEHHLLQLFLCCLSCLFTLFTFNSLASPTFSLLLTHTHAHIHHCSDYGGYRLMRVYCITTMLVWKSRAFWSLLNLSMQKKERIRSLHTCASNSSMQKECISLS